ncbi:MAG: hypothetical protein PHU49_06785 [Syntrophorhabdaceae bacterium]|jgi:hypothetical protein|nr:hypothetical protein [Syntrophorhabdaceae bacterium]
MSLATRWIKAVKGERLKVKGEKPKRKFFEKFISLPSALRSLLPFSHGGLLNEIPLRDRK